MILYENLYVKPPDKIFVDFETAFSKYDNEFMLETTINKSNESDKTKQIKIWFENMITKVSNLITDFCDMIKNMLPTKKNITTDDVINSDYGKVMLDYDLQKVQKAVDEDLLKGRKLVHALSVGTGISDKEVADYLDNLSINAIDKTKTAVSTQFALKQLYKSTNLSKNHKECCNEILRTIGNYYLNEDEKLRHLKDIYRAMTKSISEYSKIYASTAKKVEALNKK